MARQGYRRQPQQTGTIGLLDIGTSKVACLIATLGRPDRNGMASVDILGLSQRAARGVKAGVITDLDQAEQSIRAAVGEAERMARVTLEDVHISVSCGRLQSRTFTAHASIETGVVSENDLARVVAGGRTYAERDHRRLLHLNRVGYRVDGATGVSDPIGMAAEQLSVDLHAVIADEAPIRNLLMVVERCYLNAAGLVAAPYASALACTTEEERRIGVSCVDIGAGTTTIASFNEGRFVLADALAVGGNLITYDIARALQTPLAEAARIKALYGTLFVARSGADETFSYSLAGDDGEAPHTATQAQLCEAIRPGLTTIFDMLRERLASSGVHELAGERIVLTGGSSMLSGIAEFATQALGLTVRVGKPLPGMGFTAGAAGPALSTVSGLLVAAAGGYSEDDLAANAELVARGSYFGKVGSWLKSGF